MRAVKKAVQSAACLAVTKAVSTVVPTVERKVGATAVQMAEDLVASLADPSEYAKVEQKAGLSVAKMDAKRVD